jgi:hypothetical protein
VKITASNGFEMEVDQELTFFTQDKDEHEDNQAGIGEAAREDVGSKDNREEEEVEPHKVDKEARKGI